jgi:alkylation response protein AidB-like acyl-CoA dehydrogenase
MDRMIDFTLSNEQALLQKTAREFAHREILPIVEEIDQLEFSQCTPWDKFKSSFQQAARLGFTTLLIPEAYGGGGLGCIEHVLLEEEIAAVDIGVAAAYFNMSNTAPMLIINGGSEAQRDKWLREITSADGFLLASAGNEPNQAGSDSLCPFPDPQVGLKTLARRDGDDYIINGTKAAFITNGGIADAYYVIARTDLTKPPFESTSFFYVPAYLPGIITGKRTELTGWKTAHNAEVRFENLRIPKDCLLGEEGTGLPMFLMQSLPYIGVGFAACHVGLARAAYEYALSYAQSRVSWGMPIINHQAVAGKIADMYVNVQAARLMVWDAAHCIDSGSPQAGLKSPAAKTFAADAAIHNAEMAVKVLGSYGITREYKAAKMLNDAWIGWSCDGTNDVLRLHMVNFLAGRIPGFGG